MQEIQADSEVKWISREAFLVAALRAVPRIRSALGGRPIQGIVQHIEMTLTEADGATYAEFRCPAHKHEYSSTSKPEMRLWYISSSGSRIANYMSANRIEEGILRLSAALSGYSVVTINWDADS